MLITPSLPLLIVMLVHGSFLVIIPGEGEVFWANVQGKCNADHSLSLPLLIVFSIYGTSSSSLFLVEASAFTFG